MAFPCICINLALIFYQIGTKTFYSLLHHPYNGHLTYFYIQFGLCYWTFPCIYDNLVRILHKIKIVRN